MEIDDMAGNIYSEKGFSEFRSIFIQTNEKQKQIYEH